jgi:hypothetical protein
MVEDSALETPERARTPVEGGVIQADAAVALVNDMVLDIATKLDAYAGAEDEDTTRQDIKDIVQRAAGKMRTAVRANAVGGTQQEMTGESPPLAPLQANPPAPPPALSLPA